MAIKYFVNEEKRQVIGVLENTRYDAMRKIDKMLDDTDFCCYGEKYMMPSEFRTVVTCDHRDEFDVEIGKKIAKERLLKNYYASMDKRINKFREACLIFNGKVFETPEDFENNT